VTEDSRNSLAKVVAFQTGYTLDAAAYEAAKTLTSVLNNINSSPYFLSFLPKGATGNRDRLALFALKAFVDRCTAVIEQPGQGIVSKIKLFLNYYVTYNI
jgi:hypothetical protein